MAAIQFTEGLSELCCNRHSWQCAPRSDNESRMKIMLIAITMSYAGKIKKWKSEVQETRGCSQTWWNAYGPTPAAASNGPGEGPWAAALGHTLRVLLQCDELASPPPDQHVALRQDPAGPRPALAGLFLRHAKGSTERQPHWHRKHCSSTRTYFRFASYWFRTCLINILLTCT